MKIAEEGRRHRALLVDMGDESAKLKFLHGGVTPGPKGVGFVSASAGFVVGIFLNTKWIFWGIKWSGHAGG